LYSDTGVFPPAILVKATAVVRAWGAPAMTMKPERSLGLRESAMEKERSMSATMEGLSRKLKNCMKKQRTVQSAVSTVQNAV
jgi:hypothetical protein